MIDELKRRKKKRYPVYTAEFIFEMIEILLPLYKRFHKGANRDLTKEAEALVMLSQDMLKRCKEQKRSNKFDDGVEEMKAQMALGGQHSDLMQQARHEDRMSVD